MSFCSQCGPGKSSSALQQSIQSELLRLSQTAGEVGRRRMGGNRLPSSTNPLLIKVNVTDTHVAIIQYLTNLQNSLIEWP